MRQVKRACKTRREFGSLTELEFRPGQGNFGGMQSTYQTASRLSTSKFSLRARRCLRWKSLRPTRIIKTRCLRTRLSPSPTATCITPSLNYPCETIIRCGLFSLQWNNTFPSGKQKRKKSAGFFVVQNSRIISFRIIRLRVTPLLKTFSKTFMHHRWLFRVPTYCQR